MFFQKAWFLHTYVVSLALAYSLALSPSPPLPPTLWFLGVLMQTPYQSTV